MADSKVLGCWGLLVALVMVPALARMTLDLLVGLGSAMSADGILGLGDALLWREAGQ